MAILSTRGWVNPDPYITYKKPAQPVQLQYITHFEYYHLPNATKNIWIRFILNNGCDVFWHYNDPEDMKKDHESLLRIVN